MKDYRVEMTVRNNRILTHMRKMGYESVAALCKSNPELGLRETEVGRLLNLRRPAVGQDGDWTEMAMRLAAALHCGCDDLWTDAQRSVALASNRRSVEIAEGEVAKMICDSPETLMIEMERNQSIEAVLKLLTLREEKIIRMRFGLDPYHSHTLGEISKELGITPTRVRDIECKALRKLRRPHWSKKLKDFVITE